MTLCILLDGVELVTLEQGRACGLRYCAICNWISIKRDPVERMRVEASGGRFVYWGIARDSILSLTCSTQSNLLSAPS